MEIISNTAIPWQKLMSSTQSLKFLTKTLLNIYGLEQFQFMKSVCNYVNCTESFTHYRVLHSPLF